MLDDMNRQAVVEKWGEAAKAGFVMLPDLLFKHQAALGLTATELIVLLNMCIHWWYASRLPFPRSTTIAKRMNVEPRTVQRALRSLQEKRLVRKVRRGDVPLDQVGQRAAVENGGWDLSGLVARLEGLALRDASYLRRQAHAAAEGLVGSGTPGVSVASA